MLTSIEKLLTRVCDGRNEKARDDSIDGVTPVGSEGMKALASEDDARRIARRRIVTNLQYFPSIIYILHAAWCAPFLRSLF